MEPVKLSGDVMGNIGKIKKSWGCPAQAKRHI
jgi:hypothetical protein